MKITFLGHSGFLLETADCYLLFDWWKGTLPPLEEKKPVTVFISHGHEDHFNPAVFLLDDGQRDVSFLLGSDIKLTQEKCENWSITLATLRKCRSLAGGDSITLLDGLRVTALNSTDEGVAFLISLRNKTIFHAGDLNWWHWEGEDPAWNRKMEEKFKEYLLPLRDVPIDLAMLPMDPRLGDAGYWAVRYYLQFCHIQRCLPMHQWGDYGYTEAFLEKHCQYRGVLMPLHREGETLSL